MMNTSRTSPLALPTFTDEREDLETILSYLAIPQSSAEAERITGLAKSTISELLNGRRARGTHRQRHIAIVAALIRELRAIRQASTGTPERGKTALGWLHAGRIRTSQGVRTPLEVLADTALAQEALDSLYR